jgi:hypothetical protein
MTPTTRMMLQAKIPQQCAFVEGNPKGDSIVKNEEGTYAFGIVEASQALFVCRVKTGEVVPKRFLAAVSEVSEHKSSCGKYVLYIGVQKGCENWEMPDKTEEEFQIAHRNWSRISKEPIQFVK